MELSERVSKLYELGLVFDFVESAYVFKDVYVPTVDIVCSTDEEFQKIVNGCTERMKELKSNE